MSQLHWHILIVYACFVAVAVLLALARRWLKPCEAGTGVWRKIPVFLAIGLSILAAGWLPRDWHLFSALLAILAGVAGHEIARLLLPEGLLRRGLPWVSAGLIVVADWLEPGAFARLWLAVLLALTAAGTLTGRPEQLGRRWLALAACLVYLPLCLAAYAWVRRADASGFLAAFLYLTVSTNDAFAQIVGQLLGRRQLVPRLSPAKTVEGALGGILFAAAMGASLASTLTWRVAAGIGMGLAMGLAGLAGDVVASGWKRALGIKDFSSLLGAQGGVLDRFDSLIFAAPIFYLLLA